jgi:4-amino-4-deoxy-L-arabinose transferase-like glycosyltransferase
MTFLRRLANIKTILIVFSVLGAVYGLATPIFEKPDEVQHFAYIKSLADGNGLPASPIPLVDDSPAQESSQPPLYYLVAALAVRLAAPDTSDLPALLQRNPVFPYIADETRNDNKNAFIHTSPPSFQGASRAVLLARWVALAFGMLAVAATHALSRETFPDRPAIALGAAAFVAFLPQFLFITSAASNDSAAAATCALALWATIRIVRRGLTTRRAASLGIALAFAMLSKASTVALLPLALLTIAGSQGSAWRSRIGLLALPLGMVAIVAGPWYARSLVVFGDALGASTHLAMPWAYSSPLTLGDTLAQLPGAIVSFWLAFGMGNVLAPDMIYMLLNAATLIGLGFLVVSLGRQDWRRNAQAGIIYGLLLAWVLVTLAALIYWIRLLNAPLGRLAFPALPALAVLLAAGWNSIPNYRVLKLSALPVTALLALSVIALPAILLPAYTPSASLSAEQIVQQPGRPTDVRFGDVARLIRIDAPDADWPRAGDEPAIDLCWEALSPDPRRLLVVVQFVGAENRVVATRRTLPGLGAYPTAAWRPGDRFCDRVHIPILPDTPAPAVYRVEVVFTDPDARTRLPAYAPDGSPLAATFVDAIKIAPATYAEPAVENELHVRFDDQIELVGYATDATPARPGGVIGLRLYWRALRRPDADYTVFVHLRDAAGATLTQADGPPQAGAYPTSFWDAGEAVIDDRAIALPADAAPGDYTLVIGLYDLTSGNRLAIDGSAGATEAALPPVKVR